MPKSKRNKIVHLTQVKKKGKDHKEDLMKQLEEYIKQFDLVYLFDFNETKSDRIMNLRLRLKQHGRIFAGRNTVAAVTLRSIGLKTQTSYASLVRQITGHRGLFFTNLDCNKLVGLLENEQPEFHEKLLGYAHLKATDDDTRGSGDDDDDDAELDEDLGEAEAAKVKRRVVFRPIEKSKANKMKKKQMQKQKEKESGGRRQQKGTPMETQ